MSRIARQEIQDFSLWQKKERQVHSLYAFELEITARCNNNCRHCYINLPANDRQAQADELSLQEIASIADQALELGAVWVLLTGGEPLLRPDFADIYLMLKRKGLLVSVFTNAALVHDEHIALFTKYPPRDIEITIYGASPETYQAVTRVPGSYAAFVRGLDGLLAAGIRIRLKAMALRSNLADIDAMADFGRKYTKDYYRFDPVLHLRYDGNVARNAEICAERLTPLEIAQLEFADQSRFKSLQDNCHILVDNSFKDIKDNLLFHCGAGQGNFVVGYEGTFRLCSALWAPGTTLNLRKVSLRQAYDELVPRVRTMHASSAHLLETCQVCPIINLCLHCPAHAYLETGRLEGETPYFCQVAHARAAMLEKALLEKQAAGEGEDIEKLCPHA